MFKLSAIAVLALAAVASASLDCKPHGSQQELSALGEHSVKHFAFDGGKLKEGDKGEKLQFYECKAPKHFTGTNENAVFGQLRSTSEKNKCVTSGNYFVTAPGPIGGHTFKSLPKGASPAVTLQDCAESGDKLRQQWFGLTSLKKGCKPIYFAGEEEDVAAPTIGSRNGGVSFSPMSDEGPSSIAMFSAADSC